VAPAKKTIAEETKLSSLFRSQPEHPAEKTSANWRVTFIFVGEDAEVVNYEDYH
jgi:plasmid maintenance system killer protein